MRLIRRSLLIYIVAVVGAARVATAADFFVTTTNGTGAGSLHQAITEANSTPGADRILFNIPGAGVHTIDASRDQLPIVEESLVIDGYSQPGAKPNSLTTENDAVILIRIDGGSAGLHGLVFYGTTSDYVVRGLCLTGFRGTNGIVGAITAGVVRSAVVAGNFIGVLPDGETFGGNYIGVGHVTRLGGTDPASRNIISGNAIGFAGEAAPAPETARYGALVQGNYFGTNASGTKALPNSIAIGLATIPTGICAERDIDLSATVIGGGAPGARNLISGNGAAIVLGRTECGGNRLPAQPVRANGVRIQANSIGMHADGYGALPNSSGITIIAGANNLIGGILGEGNVIGYNGTGVVITGGPGSIGNQISYNAIFRNQEQGIDLGDDGVTPNDADDSDSGPNSLQNYPLIDSVIVQFSSRGHAYANITGRLNSKPNSTFQLEFFGGSTAASSAPSQGELSYGTFDVTTDANGHAAFNFYRAVDSGRPVYTVTATDSTGNTSEFSPAFIVPPAQLLNLATRSHVGRDEDVVIGGFIIAGTEKKTVMVRGLGPSLAEAGVSGALADPTLALQDSTGVHSNNNWKEGQADEISATGMAPKHDAESAIIANLPARSAGEGGAAYTVVLAGNHATTGVGLLEIYDLAAEADSSLVNISTRGRVGTGANVLIGGVIPRPYARSSQTLLIRAVGPSLAARGVADALVDPMLELHDANGTMISANDDWRESSEATRIAATGIPPTNDNESAILHFIPAGASDRYTAVVRGSNETTGVALVEIYSLN